LGLATALSLLVGLVAAGVCSPNMLVNLNPPTGALVLLGVVQICGLRLVHSRLSAMLTGAGGSAAEAGSEHSPDPELSPSVELSSGAEAVPAVRILRAQFWRRLIAWGNRFGMQVYLWHMSVVIVLIGGLGWLAQAVSGVPHLAEFVLPAVGWGCRPRSPWRRHGSHFPPSRVWPPQVRRSPDSSVSCAGTGTAHASVRQWMRGHASQSCVLRPAQSSRWEPPPSASPSRFSPV